MGVDVVPNSAGQSPYLVNIVQLRTSNSHEDIAHLIFWDPEADSRPLKTPYSSPRLLLNGKSFDSICGLKVSDKCVSHSDQKSCTVQTKKITQNAGRSILVPDFWIWRPVVDIPQPRFREGAGGEVSRKSKIWPKMAFFGPGTRGGPRGP